MVIPLLANQDLIILFDMFPSTKRQICRLVNKKEFSVNSLSTVTTGSN